MSVGILALRRVRGASFDEYRVSESRQISAGAARRINPKATVSSVGAPCDAPQPSQLCALRCAPHVSHRFAFAGVVMAASVPKIVNAINSDRKRRGLSHGKICDGVMRTSPLRIQCSVSDKSFPVPRCAAR